MGEARKNRRMTTGDLKEGKGKMGRKKNLMRQKILHVGGREECNQREGRKRNEVEEGTSL